jgi:hypothetical protein
VHRVFEEYLHRLELAADKHQFREALKEFAAQFGHHSFAYLTLPRSNRQKMRAISTYDPVWVSSHLVRRKAQTGRQRNPTSAGMCRSASWRHADH